MALIKSGSLAAQTSGTVGGQVYARNRGGSYVRNWAKPVNQPTPAQSAQRATFGSQSTGWQSLTTGQQNAWQLLGQNTTMKNRIGDDYIPTGRQLYTATNAVLMRHNQDILADAPPDMNKPDTPADLVADITVDAGAFDTMTITGTLPNGLMIVVDCTQPMNPSINNASRYYRQLGVFTAATGALAIKIPYVAKYSSAAGSGLRVNFRCKTLDPANGTYGPAVLFNYNIP